MQTVASFWQHMQRAQEQCAAQSSHLLHIGSAQIRKFAQFLLEHHLLLPHDHSQSVTATHDATSTSSMRHPLPLNFASVEDEISIYMLYWLLMCGSGWQSLLPQQRSVADTVSYGILSLFLSFGERCASAERLVSYTRSDVDEHFQLPVTVDRPIAVGGAPSQTAVTVQRNSTLYGFAAILCRLMNDTGRVMMLRRFERLYDACMLPGNNYASS